MRTPAIELRNLRLESHAKQRESQSQSDVSEDDLRNFGKALLYFVVHHFSSHRLSEAERLLLVDQLLDYKDV